MNRLKPYAAPSWASKLKILPKHYIEVGNDLLEAF